MREGERKKGERQREGWTDRANVIKWEVGRGLRPSQWEGQQ